MDSENLDLILNTTNEYNIHSFASNEEMSSDLQKRLKRINKLTDGLYETKFKIDRYKFDRALKSTFGFSGPLSDRVIRSACLASKLPDAYELIPRASSPRINR